MCGKPEISTRRRQAHAAAVRHLSPPPAGGALPRECERLRARTRLDAGPECWRIVKNGKTSCRTLTYPIAGVCPPTISLLRTLSLEFKPPVLAPCGRKLETIDVAYAVTTLGINGLTNCLRRGVSDLI
ncbi:hypothetical protein EVAR_76757_1 [Eumeta japonica]|uniref:Uncharacterized protein n=1 Tax=Eumeta variegata TaxID=151549 RepID=A0A4C1SVR0_EUMVA|nr:hypothetical protein EVAR_76757_1 [Eumeta japonica]